MNIFGRLFLFLGISLTPIYLFSSGGIQISHAILGVFLAFFVAFRGIQRGAIEQVLLMLLLVVFLREALDVFQGAPARALLAAAYLLFNLLLLNVVRRLAVDRIGFPVIKWGIVVSSVIAILGVLILGYRLTLDDEGGRAVGTFNNPNQLGYFSVCLLSVILLFRMTGNLSAKLMVFLGLGAVFLAIASLSKAAMLSVAMATAFAGFAFVRRRGALVTGAAVIGLLVVAGSWLYSSGALDQFTFIRRLQGIGTAGDDSLEARGYFVVFESSAFEALFGMGSTKARELIGHEIHSTVFSYLGNYGAIGGILLVTALVMWGRAVYRGLGWRGVMLVVVPPMLYGITHNGSRFTMFWLLVALSTALCGNLALATRRAAHQPGDAGLRARQSTPGFPQGSLR